MTRSRWLLLLSCALTFFTAVVATASVKSGGGGGGVGEACSCEPDADAPGAGSCVVLDPVATCGSLTTCTTGDDCAEKETCVSDFALNCGGFSKCIPDCPGRPPYCASPSPDPQTLSPCNGVPMLGRWGALLVGILLLAAVLPAIRRRGPPTQVVASLLLLAIAGASYSAIQSSRTCADGDLDTGPAIIR